MYNTANNSFGKFEASIGPSATSFIMQSAYSKLFPLHNGTTDADYFLKLEQKDVLGAVIKREIVKVTARSGVLFTIVRGAGLCPASDTATTQTNTAFSFSAGDSISLTVVSEHIQQIESDLSDKANDDEVIHLTGDETIDGVKTFSSSPKAPDPTDDDDVATKGYVIDSLQVNNLQVGGFIAGEVMSKGQLFRKGLGTALFIQNTTAPFSGAGVNACSIGYNTSSYEFGQSFTLASDSTIFDIQLNLIASGSPNLQVNIELFSDAGFTTLVGTSETKTLTTGGVITFVFPTPVFRTAGVVYFKANNVSGTTSTTNYLYTNYSNTNPYAGGVAYNITSAGVVTSPSGTDDKWFKVNSLFPSGLSEDTSKKYKASASSIVTNKIQGATRDSVVLNGVFAGVLAGYVDGYTGLTDGLIYKLQDNGTIGLTSGTVDTSVGISIGTTAISFITPL